MTHRHLHSTGTKGPRPSCRDRLNGWNMYTNLFDMVLEEGTDDFGLYLLPEWAFDIMHEFVYQFQGFCQFRTTSSDKRKDEDLQLLSENDSAWAVDKVMYYLHALMEKSVNVPNDAEPSSGTLGLKNLGVFAAVSLSRLECLLADYNACLLIFNMDIVSKQLNDDGIIKSVFSAKISLAYHAGVSYLMLNRYKDAIDVLESVCSEIQRFMKTSQIQSIAGHDQQQFYKQFDRMLALLAILINICPSSTISLDGNKDSIGSMVREKFGAQLTKIESGEEGYEGLFGYACPKFIDPFIPDYSKNLPAGYNLQTHNLQVSCFINEMEKQRSLRSLHSYMKLYTTIGVKKLGVFNGCSNEEECVSQLLSLKQKMLQKEGRGNDLTSVLNIHYFVDGDLVHVEEAQKQKRFEGYYLTRISQCKDVQKALDEIIILP